MARKPTLAVWKFASCDGCQLSLLDCEDELLAIADAVTIAHFPEASRAVVEGPYDVSLVEGSITTAHDAERIQQVRRDSTVLVTLGACATAGGIQALRNGRDLGALVSAVYPRPDYIETLATSTPIRDHVAVDLELRGCPVDKRQLLEVLSALLHGRAPVLPSHAVCMECKMRGNVCVTVAHGTPCLGPVTHAGCHALCPSFGRGCFGCFGPSDSAHPEALAPVLARAGASPAEVQRLYATFHVAAEPFERGRLIALGRKPVESEDTDA